MFPRLKALSQPIHRPLNNKTSYDDIYKVKKSALTYVASERIKQLAQPKKVPKDTILRSNFEKNSRKRVLKSMEYQVSDRILKLSEPKVAPIKIIKRKKDYLNPEALILSYSKRIHMLLNSAKRS